MPEYFVDDTCSSTPVGDMGTRFEDFNGDGLVDVLKARDSDGLTDSIYLNRGNGAWSTTTPAGIKPMVNTAEGVNARVADVNGDGLADFVTGWASTTINTGRGVPRGNQGERRATIRMRMAPGGRLTEGEGSPTVVRL